MFDSRRCVPKLLQMLLAALVSTKSQAVAAAKRCQTQAHAGHETARIGFQPPDNNFWVFMTRGRVVQSDSLQSLHRGRNMRPPRRP
jgi:hypothetical protein